jgi:O-antigen/teichoic acid export membrane protein
MNLSKKIAYNTIVQIASKVVATILGLITLGIMARYLGQTGFGEYTTIMTFLSFFAVVADLGLTLVTTQMLSAPSADENRILSNLFGLRLVTAVIFLGLAPLAVWFMPYDATIKWGVVLSLWSFFFVALNQVLVGLFQKKLRLDKVSIAEVAGRLALLAGVIITAYYRLPLYGMLAATVSGSAVSFYLHYLFARKFAHISLAFDFSLWREIFKKSWPIGVTIVFNLIYLRADTLILSLTRSQAEVGIYGATYKVIDVLITLPFIFAGIVLPILTQSWLTDRERFKRIMQKSFDLMMIFTLPLVVGAQFVAGRLMILVAGSDFAASGVVLRVLILAAGIIFLGTIFSHAIIAVDQQKKIIKAYVFTALTALAGYLIFIPRFSYFGAAWVTIYSELSIAIAAFWLVKKQSGFRPDLRVSIKAGLATLMMATSIYPLRNQNLFLLVATAGLIYCGALYLFRGIKKEDIDALIQ